MWNQFRKLRKFDRYDIMAAHSITKRDAGVLYRELMKIHYDVMRFKATMTADEADALAGRAKTVAAQHYAIKHSFGYCGKGARALSQFLISFGIIL